jgi:fido (protein-threonine AMPylation protein)
VTTAPRPPFQGVDWDDALERMPLVGEAITLGMLRVERWLVQRASSVELNLEIVQAFHRLTFQDVFPDFAGRLRGPAPRYIPRNVSFGNYRGEVYERVPAACAELFAHVPGLIRQLDDLQAGLGDDDFDEQVLRVAAFVHCELIRIHPFVNGNGRTARSCINYFARRYGVYPLPFGRPQGDYLEANRSWLQGRAIEHFVDFLRPMWRRIAAGR